MAHFHKIELSIYLTRFPYSSLYKTSNRRQFDKSPQLTPHSLSLSRLISTWELRSERNWAWCRKFLDKIHKNLKGRMVVWGSEWNAVRRKENFQPDQLRLVFMVESFQKLTQRVNKKMKKTEQEFVDEFLPIIIKLFLWVCVCVVCVGRNELFH